MQASRNANYDLMRCLAAFAVVWLHVAAQFATSTPDIHNYNWWVANIADALSRWCVPIFVMLSGALLLGSDNNYSLPTFYKRRLSRLLIPLVFWTFFYIAFRYITEPTLNIAAIPSSIIIGKPYFHLWYLYMVIGLYAITPYLQTITQHMDRYSLLGLIIFSLAISSIEFLAGSNTKTFLAKFIAYVGYFLGGYYLSTFCQKHNTIKMAIGVVACGFAIALLTAYYLEDLGGSTMEIMYDYLNPLVILMSFFAFLLFKNINITEQHLAYILTAIAPLSLGIYLIHPIWLWILNRYIFWRFDEINLIVIPMLSISAFALSIATSFLIAKTKLFRQLI